MGGPLESHLHERSLQEQKRSVSVRSWRRPCGVQPVGQGQGYVHGGAGGGNHQVWLEVIGELSRIRRRVRAS